MEQKKTLEKVERKYSDIRNQIAKVNKNTIIGLTIIELFLIFALILQASKYSKQTAFGKLGIVPTIILLVGVVVNWVMYIRDKKSDKLRYYMFVSFIVGWIYLMVLGTNILVSFYIYPLVIATLLYHDKKYEHMLFYSMLGATVLRTIAWAKSGQLLGGDSVSITSIIVHLEIIIILHSIAKLSAAFTDDMLGSVQDEQETQQIMLHEVLDISENVQHAVSDTNELIENLKNDASLVHDSIEDISGRTQNTVDSVKEQSQMTKRINQDIEDTAENAKIMVEAATLSSKLLAENMTVICFYSKGCRCYQ